MREGLGVHYLKYVTCFPAPSVAKAARPMKCFCLKLSWGRITTGLLSRWNSHAETCSPAMLWCLLQSRAAPGGCKAAIDLVVEQSPEWWCSSGSVNFIIYFCFRQSPRLAWFLFPLVVLGKRWQTLAECLQEIAEQQSSLAQPGCYQRWNLKNSPSGTASVTLFPWVNPNCPAHPMLLGKALTALPPLLFILTVVDVEKALGRRDYTASLLQESRYL